MSDQIYEDLFGDEIVLNNRVREVILVKHPEVNGFIDKIEIVLQEPDEIRQSVRDERVVLYYRYESEIFDGKWLVVVVKRIDQNFISTIYITDQIKSGDIRWRK